MIPNRRLSLLCAQLVVCLWLRVLVCVSTCVLKVPHQCDCLARVYQWQTIVFIQKATTISIVLLITKLWMKHACGAARCCVCVITRLKHRDRTHVVTRCFFFSSSTHSLPSIFSSFFFCFVGRERKSRLDPERTFLRFPQCPSVVRIVPIRRERSAITNEFTIFIFFLEKERKEKTHSRFGNFPSSRV